MCNIPKRFWVVPAIVLATLTACSSMPATPSPTVWSPSFIRIGQVEELMLYYDHLRKQPATELAKEYDKARQDFAKTRSELNRVKVALLLSLPNAPFHDTLAALNLLNELPKETKDAPSGLRSFANFLGVLLAEQQRAISSADDLSQKLKDEQKRARALQEKVDAIKNMEKNLIRRDKQ